MSTPVSSRTPLLPRPRSLPTLRDLDRTARPRLLRAAPSLPDGRVADFVHRAGALALLLALSPLLGALAIAIRLSSRGPVLFRQQRVGRGGEPFPMLKFRSMVRGAEAHEDRLASDDDGPFFKVREDARVTAIGRLIRRLSLDELPQLWNVVVGDMRLVGPRPLMLREHRELPAEVRAWRDSAPPGVTGLWQVSGRSATTAATRLRFDRLYVARRSALLDAWLLLRTPAAVLRGHGAV